MPSPRSRSAEIASIHCDASYTDGRGNYSADLYAPGTPKYALGTSSCVMKVAGYTVYSRSGSGSLSYTKSYYRTFFKSSATFTVGPVPVIVSATLKGGIQTGIGVTSASTMRLHGYARAYAKGYASAGVGVKGASTGLESDFRLADTRGDLNVSCGNSSKGGSILVRFNAIKIKLSLYAKLKIGWVQKKWTKIITSWSTPGWTRTYTLR